MKNRHCMLLISGPVNVNLPPTKHQSINQSIKQKHVHGNINIYLGLDTRGGDGRNVSTLL